jgi:hypothetical protein
MGRVGSKPKKKLLQSRKVIDIYLDYFYFLYSFCLYLLIQKLKTLNKNILTLTVKSCYCLKKPVSVSVSV